MSTVRPLVHGADPLDERWRALRRRRRHLVRSISWAAAWAGALAIAVWVVISGVVGLSTQ